MKKSIVYIVAAYIIVVMALFMSAGCTGSHKFKDGLKEIEGIDAKHETSMYKERLDKVMLNVLDVEEMLNDLEAIESKLKYSSKSDDVKALLLLIEFRKKMLEAELDMINVRHIGSKGNVMDGFSCKDRGHILNSSLLMKSSVYKGAEALATLDKLTGFAVASEYIGRDKIEFDESDVERLLLLANQGISIGKEGGLCDE